MKIVIVEDNPGIREELSRFLERYGYETAVPDSFEGMPQNILELSPDLVLLDLNLPVYDGYYVCRELRKLSSVPVIVVTSRDSEMDELMSMNLGADDFVTKPYHSQILLARIGSVLRRAKGGEVRPEELSCRGLCLNLSRSSVSYGGKELELSKNEARILHCLMKEPERIHSREEIMEALWQTDCFVDDNTLTVNVTRLRKRLASIGAGEFISTKRGQGYLL